MIDWLRKEAIEPEIELSGRTLSIALRRDARARRLTLRLAPDGSEVRLTLPRWCRSAEALAFVHARRDWLECELARIPQRALPTPGGTISHRGAQLAIAWQEGAPRRARLLDGRIVIGGPLENLAHRLQRWLEAEALHLLGEDLAHYCGKAGLAVPQLRLSRAQRRWGSCSSGGTVRINWRLVQAPDFVRRSVVAHEVAHLVHFDHSPSFRALLGQLYGGSSEDADAWLKVNGRGLYAAFG